MLVYILVGLFALLVKNVNLTKLSPRLQVQGRHARNYGITLLVGAIPFSLITSQAMIWLLPESIGSVKFIIRILDLILSAGIALALIPLFRSLQLKEEREEQQRLSGSRSED